MHWLICMPLLLSFVTAAPQNAGFSEFSVDLGGSQREEITSVASSTISPPLTDENPFPANCTAKKTEESDDENVTENHPNESKNNVRDILTESVLNIEEAHETTVKEAEEGSSIREDSNQTGQTQSETPAQSVESSLTPSSGGQAETAPETLAVSEGTSTESTTKIPATSATTKIPTTKRPKPSKPKPPRATTAKPLSAESSVTPAATARPTVITVKPTRATPPPQRYPCRCADGTCACCTGIVLENFNVPLRSRACANVTYEPEEFAFNFKLAYNNIVLYNRRMSAKNPRPACIPINRYFGIKMCAKLSNVYMSGRNVHACLEFEGFFDDETAFKYSFNCFRIGTQGVAIVRPEDGGGLPPPPDEEEQTDEDYDDSARSSSHTYNNDDSALNSSHAYNNDSTRASSHTYNNDHSTLSSSHTNNNDDSTSSNWKAEVETIPN